MSDTDTSPFVKSIFHPSDFSAASELAFAHARRCLCPVVAAALCPPTV